MNPLLRFLRSDDGATAVEYSVMLALIIMVAIGSITTLGGANSGFWHHISSSTVAAFDAADAGS